MPSLPAVDLAQISQGLGLLTSRVEIVLGLLDSGNTVPFITRYRKDQTGGMDEEQIRDIQSRVLKARLLAERKQTILRSIESQGKLTPELTAAIEAATTVKAVEDLYLPFKPKKQTLATTARNRGLELLATEILQADPACANLDLRAADFVNTDRQVATPADALLGAGHILAEWFSERADLRGKLRAILERTGKLVSTGVEPEPKKEPEAAKPIETEASNGEQPAEKAGSETSASSVESQQAAGSDAEEESSPATTEVASSSESESIESSQGGQDIPVETADAEAEGAASLAAVDAALADLSPEDGSAATAVATGVEADSQESAAAVAVQPAPAVASEKKRGPKPPRKPKPDPKREKLLKALRDYYQYSEAIDKVPPHRVLAINRGERVRVLRVKLECDLEAMQLVVDELLVPPGHPHADFLRGCGRDALTRLVLPSLEREVRRELTDSAELHAVEVFVRNLRKLLLQSPVRDRRVLAMDPGFKSGCKLVALDEFGSLLDHAVIHLVGKEDRRAAARAKVTELVKQHQITVIAIGNGTGCRETEQFVADLIAGELADLGVAYVIVNEAGASVYSTSRIGREEFPNFDATLRGAISIGRRLEDPLSELVKIDPANIGVGMYQHDVKAKHLRDSLDAVVESCVNFVGVDLNTASPALLRYVSGLNQLTAQRVYEHRTAQGPFRTREQLKSVSGFGETTFVQAAGFLKIVGGDSPLDATWIHPESYAAAIEVLNKLGASPADLADKERATQLAERTAQLDVDAVAQELKIGTLTLRDILAQLARPGRDPREALPPPIFKRGILKLDDLTSGMELAGTVLNVVDFGAFIDIGLKDSGLVHISQLANRYVQDPHDVVSVGDIVKVWVLEVDKQRRRVSLTMIEPGTKRPAENRRPARPARPPAEKQTGDGQPAAGQQPAQQSGGRPPAGGQGRQQRFRKPDEGRQPYSKKPKFKPPAAAPPKPAPKPKPVVPLTEAMKKGKAPLRTFGDLKQFMSLKPTEPPQPPEGEAT
jgi:uncharacterized protein